MAITFVNSATGNADNFNNVTVTCPATQSGDLIIAECYERNASGSSASGLGLTWTQAGSPSDGASHLAWAIATGDHSGGTITWGSGTGGVSVVTVYRGVDTSNPFGAATLVTESNASGNETQAQITTTVDGAMVCLTVGTNGTNAISSQSCTSPGGLTERGDVSNVSTGTDIAHASAIKTTAGATGSFTWAQTNSSGVSWAYALKPFTFSGTSALSVPAQTLAGLGKKSALGTSALIVPIQQLAGSGKQIQKGISALLTPMLTLSGVGKKSALGTGALSVPVQVIAGTGTKTATAATGTGTITIPMQTLAGVGRAPYVGTGTFRIPALTLTGSGKQIYKATGAFTLPMQVLAATGKQTMKATGAFIVPMLRLAGSGKQTYSGTGALTLPVQVVAASGHMTFTGTGTLAIPMLVLSGVAQIVLPPFVLCEFVLVVPQYTSQLILPSYTEELTVPNYNGKLTIPAEELIHNLSSMAEVRSVRGN